MDTLNVVIGAIALVMLVLYLMRRRSRLRADDE